ncbi:hypothetical protein [Pseudomonas sp. MWU16-30317]|uniref:hypothetical protein n=1 Tax=Pseudomonas sp. MWU16-30317 TaxID=2878095 RepID=UPI001CFBC504|nr:hypothetical protein [Pseudomonas sp. MWU16-30317]
MIVNFPGGGNVEAPHIDIQSFSHLAVLLHDLQRFLVAEPEGDRADEVRRMAVGLNNVLARFEPPVGAA